MNELLRHLASACYTAMRAAALGKCLLHYNLCADAFSALTSVSVVFGSLMPDEDSELLVPPDVGSEPTQRNIMLTIAYDGAAYQGWQVQPNGVTVQECVESAVLRLTGEKRRVFCAGRTDSGVHALGQVANFHTNSRIPVEKLRGGLQTFLPADIVVVSASEAAATFHATYSAVTKRYRYVIFDGDVCPPFLRNYVQRSRVRLNADLMAEAAQHLLGTHDFRCFETKYPNKETSVRTVMDVSLRRLAGWHPWTTDHDWLPAQNPRHDHADRPFIVFEIMADGFLYNMVRAIVGTLTEIGRGKNPPECIVDVVRSMDRARAGMTAVPGGLYLVHVEYPDDLHHP